MADYAPTKISILGNTVQTVVGVAGEAVVERDVVYLKSDQKYWKAKASGLAEEAQVAGICLTAAAIGGKVLILLPTNEIDLGVTLTVGTEVVLSANAGKLAPRSDLVSTNFITSFGYPDTSAILGYQINITGTTVP